ncbi:MAG: type II/IV secretion system ATPase subunit, partial [Candidatus Thermoplasmatota archaeon]
MKNILKEEEKEERKKAMLLLSKYKIDEFLSKNKKIIEELKSIQQSEEILKAKESLSMIKRGEDIEKIIGFKKEVVQILPPREDYIEVIEVHPIKKPYSYIRILYDNKNHEYVYEVIEPFLSIEEKRTLDFIKETLIKTMDIELTEFKEEEAKEYLRKNVNRIIRDYSIKIDDITKDKIMYYVIRDFLGYGKIDVLMTDPMIEDISCDAAGVPIFIYHRNYESLKTNIYFQTDDELDSFVIQLAQKCGRHISISRPLLDATMPDGSRLQACLAREVSSMGSNFTVRRFREEPFTPTHLVEFNTISPELAAYFWLAIEHGASAIIAGGTASG